MLQIKRFFTLFFTYLCCFSTLCIADSEAIKKTYLYYPNSNKIAVAYSWLDNKIVMRQAFAYTSSGTIGIVTTDDGCLQDINSLEGATYRKILYMTPDKRFPLGIPAVLEEKVLNLQTKEEVLLKVIKHYFSPEGWLIKQEVYDSDSKLTSFREWGYDDKGNMVRQINEVGDEILWGYDERGNRNYEKGPRQDKHKEITYDKLNRVIRIDEIHADKTLSTHYSYDTAGRKISEIDSYGQETNFIYDVQGNLIQIIKPAVEDENGKLVRPITMYTYSQGLPSSQIDPQGNITRFQYYSKERPLKITYPDGSEESYAYNAAGEVCKQSDKYGTTLISRDYLGRIVKLEKFSASGNLLWTAAANYDSLHMTSETDALGVRTDYYYDILGRKIKQVRGSLATLFENDGIGRVVKEIQQFADGETKTQAFIYDALDRVIEAREEDASGALITKKRFEYDEEGNTKKISTYGAHGEQILQTVFDSHGMMTTTDPYGNETVEKCYFKYENGLGQNVPCKVSTDPLNRKTTSIFDSLNHEREITKVDASGKLIQKNEFFFDILGNLKSEKMTFSLQNGGTKTIHTCYEYDNMHRRIAKNEFAGTKNEKKTNYQYDAKGNLTSLEKPSGIKVLYNYTPDGLLESCFSNDNTICYVYSYDSLNRLVLIKNEINKTTHKFAYDSAGLLIQEILPNGLSIKYEYNQDGSPAAKIMPDGSKIRYTYALGRINTVELASSKGETILKHSYNAFDLSGHPIQEILGDRSEVIVKSYDKLGKLSGVNSLQYKETIPEDGWDPLRNVVKKSIKDARGDHTLDFCYNSIGQLVKESEIHTHSYLYHTSGDFFTKDKTSFSYNEQNELVQAGKQHFSLDKDGNIIDNKSERYFYDALGRLIAIKTDKFDVIYTYDAFNRRLSKRICSFNQSQECVYLYDGKDEIACYCNGEPVELCLRGIDGIIGVGIKNQIYSTIIDCSGNVIALIDPAGQLIEGYHYTDYGDEFIFDNKAKNKQPINPWRFSSQRFDKETGLYFANCRYYDPELGIFLTKEIEHQAYFDTIGPINKDCSVSSFRGKL